MVGGRCKECGSVYGRYEEKKLPKECDGLCMGCIMRKGLIKMNYKIKESDE